LIETHFAIEIAGKKKKSIQINLNEPLYLVECGLSKQSVN